MVLYPTRYIQTSENSCNYGGDSYSSACYNRKFCGQRERLLDSFFHLLNVRSHFFLLRYGAKSAACNSFHLRMDRGGHHMRCNY